MGVARQALLALVALALLGLPGCQRPATALRKRPAQRVELVLEVKGVTPAEERALLEQAVAQVGLAEASPEEREAPIRVLRLTLMGHPDPKEQRGLAATWAASVGSGALAGVALPAQVGIVALGAMPYTVGAGVVGGLVYGPIEHHQAQALLRTQGYLPWVIWAEVAVLDRGPGPAERRVASRRVAPLDLRPHLPPLPPEARTEANLRRLNLSAALMALQPELRIKD